MSRGINRVTLIGNLGADPEARTMPDGRFATNVRMATTSRWKDKVSGEPKEDTQWHRVIFYGNVGQVAAKYLNKGSQIYVEGRLHTRKWQAKDGSDRYTTEVIGGVMQMLGGGGTNDRTSAEAANGKADSAPANEFDDDIPF